MSIPTSFLDSLVGKDLPRRGDRYRFTHSEKVRHVFRGKEFVVVGHTDYDGSSVLDLSIVCPGHVVVEAPDIKLSQKRRYSLAIGQFSVSSNQVELVKKATGLSFLFEEIGASLFIDSTDPYILEEE